MQEYVKVGAKLGLLLGVASLPVGLLRAQPAADVSYLRMMVAVLVVTAAAALFGAAAMVVKYYLDVRQGVAAERAQQMAAVPGIMHFLVDLASPFTVAFYVAIASILVRAAGGPGLLSVALLALGVALVATGLNRRRPSPEASGRAEG